MSNFRCRRAPVLLAKLYAEQMFGAKEKAEDWLPENVPDLMLEYVNEVNRKEGGLDDRTVHAVAKKVAGECLKETYRPAPAKIETVLGALGGDTAQDRIIYLEQKLRLVETIGVGRDRIRFALDPLAEYLAGLHVVEKYGGGNNEWQEFLARADAAAGAPETIKGFLLAVLDCCHVRRAQQQVPGVVTAELRKRCGLDPEGRGEGQPGAAGTAPDR